MASRVPAPGGRRNREGLPILILPDGTILRNGYTMTYLRTMGASVCYKGVKEWKLHFIREVESRDAGTILALTREKFLLDQLSHKAIVKTVELFEEGGYYYLALEYIMGTKLEQLITPGSQAFLRESVINDWAHQLYDIFEYLHSQDPPVVFGDLNPQNVIKDKEGHLHLVDFKFASMGEHGSRESLNFSPHTVTPEHYSSRRLDERTDVYMTGALLHYMLTNGKGKGSTPFTFIPLRTLNPALSAHCEQVVMRALEKEPQKRFQTVREMALAHFPSRGAEKKHLTPEIGINVQAAGQQKEPIPGAPSRGRSLMEERFLNAPVSVKIAATAVALCGLMVGAGLLMMGSGKHGRPAPLMSPAATVQPSDPGRPHAAILQPGETMTPDTYPFTMPSAGTGITASPSSRPTETKSQETPSQAPTSLPSSGAVPTVSRFTPPPSRPVMTRTQPSQPEVTQAPLYTPPATPAHGTANPSALAGKREVISRLTGVYYANFDEPHGMPSGKGFKIKSSTAGFSVLVPDDYLQANVRLQGLDVLKNRELDSKIFVTVGQDGSERSLRFLGVAAYQVPEGALVNDIYSSYFEDLKRQGVLYMAVKQARGANRDNCYAVAFDYKPPFLKAAQKYGQIAYAGLEKDKLYVLSASSSQELFDSFTQEIQSFFNSFER